jgi:hypothetical protein
MTTMPRSGSANTRTMAGTLATGSLCRSCVARNRALTSSTSRAEISSAL